MTVFIYEFMGTAMLILFGNGVVANVLLSKSKGQNSGWIVITFGWAMAVFVAVLMTSKSSGGHLNPVVTLSMAYLGRLDWSLVPVYISAQMLGAMAGATLVWLSYKKHYDATAAPELKLATFCTDPGIRHLGANLLSEVIATFAFMLAVLYLAAPDKSMGSIEALPVALIVLAIGLSLGGTTGYAINPARDLGPRIAHFLLPIKGKQHSDWGYAIVPVIGPIIGGLLATGVYHFLHLP